MQTEHLLTFIAFFIIVCAVSSFKRRFLKTIASWDHEGVLMRDLGRIMKTTGLLALVVIYLGQWALAVAVFSAPCFWALGSLLKGSLAGHRRSDVVSRVPPQVPARISRSNLPSGVTPKLVAFYVLLIAYLWWTSHRS